MSLDYQCVSKLKIEPTKTFALSSFFEGNRPKSDIVAQNCSNVFYLWDFFCAALDQVEHKINS